MKKAACLLLSTALLATSPVYNVIASTDEKITDLTLPTSISLSEDNITMVRKQPKMQLTATLYPSNTDQSVSYESSDTKIASVDRLGRITAKKEGTCEIKVTSTKNKDLYKTCYVTVTEQTVNIESFEADKTDYHCVVGKKVKLKYDIKPSGASNTYIKWTVEDKDVASVDSSGYVYGIKEGETTVTGKTDDGGFELSFDIEVVEENTDNYDKFEEDYPNLVREDEQVTDDGVWIEIEDVGKVFYDTYLGEFVKSWNVIDGKQYYFKDTTFTVWTKDENYDPNANTSSSSDDDSSVVDEEDEHEGEISSIYTLPLMQTGWYQSLNSWCYLKDDGSAAINEWIRDDNKWYLLDKEGNMVSNGEKWIGGDRYLFAQSGEAITGFREVDDFIKHYNQATCKMDLNNWFQEQDSRWYYADNDGNIVKNQYVKSVDGTYDYYVDNDGVLVINQLTPDGRVSDNLGRIGFDSNVSKMITKESSQVDGRIDPINNSES